MNDNAATETREFVLRRLTMTIKDWPWRRDDWYHIEDARTWWLWAIFLGVILAIGTVYVIWMYVRDGSTIGKGWGALLALLRLAVYALLGFVFLLPAYQKGEDSKQKSKVIVLGDVSQSMDHRDAPLALGVDPNSRLTRKDEILKMIYPDKGDDFFKRLVKNNAVTIYRFGGTLDDNFWVVDQDGHVKDKKSIDESKHGEGELFDRGFLTRIMKPNKDDPVLNDEQKNTLKRLVQSTNVGGSVQAVLTKERNNIPQGIILFSDCRSNSGSAAAALTTVADEARRAKIPVFVVIVGEDHPETKMEIADIRGPDWVRPEDPFRVTVDVSAKGLGNRSANVVLDVYPPGVDPKDPKTGDKLTTLPLGDKDDPEKKVVFKRNDLSVEQVEFEIHPSRLGMKEDVKPDKPPPAKPGAKPEESVSTKPKLKSGEWKFVPRVARDADEGAGDEFHTHEPLVVRVEDKPLRVLLLASAPTRDYQFVRTMLVREFDKHRLDLAIYLQPLPNQAGSGPRQRRTGIVQDVPPERLLTRFPDKFAKIDPKKNMTAEEEKKALGEALYNLANYDVIVAFDPDWSDDTIDPEKLDDWVEQQGGGLIVVAGPINTLELARAYMKVKDHVQKSEEKAAFKRRDANGNYINPLGRYVSILDMYPVFLKDSRLEKDRNTAEPAGLKFMAEAQDKDFLKLDEENPNSKLTDAWVEFFGRGKGKDGSAGTGKVSRGFYGYYPVAAPKASAQVIAKFVDDSSEKKTEAPYLVALPDYGTGRVIWLGSGETWRLRQFKEVWHERLWTKMVRYAGAHSLGTSATRRVIPEIGNRFPSGSKIKVVAKFLGRDLKPLGPKESPPKIVVRPPAGVVGLEPEYIMKPETTGQAAPDEGPGEDKKPSGRFYAEFPADMPGKYSVDILLEGEPPSTHVLDVYQEDPESGDTSPDWAAAYALASDADDVLARIEDRDKAAELEKKLDATLKRYKSVATKEGEEKPAPADKEKGAKDKKKEDKLRLVFTLDNADMIPECMRKHENTQHTRGKVIDYWDEGFTMPIFGWRVSYVLLGVVGLLAIEWLTRKLLRLA